MKKFLLLGTIFVATSVWAFSGIGIGPLQRHKSKSGVDAIGIHIDGNGKKADIDIVDGDSQEDPCPDGVSRDSKGFCALCDNGNLYFPYRENPCEEATNINKTSCESGTDCERGCCSTNGWCTRNDPDLDECISGITCLGNDDCASGEFCRIDYEWGNPFGVCQLLGSYRTINYNDKIFTQSEIENLSFLGALHYCHALNKEMATMEDLAIPEDLVCGPWQEQSCDAFDLSIFYQGEYESFRFWLNNGTQIGEGDYEYFRMAAQSKDDSPLRIIWFYDREDDTWSNNGALCK